jgi:uncharacterized protein YpmB
MENKAKKLKALSIVAICVILILCVCLVIFSGCAKKSSDFKEQENNRFIFIEEYKSVDDNDGSFFLVVDKETKIIYIYTSEGGITPLLDSKGEPQKYKGVL